VGREGHRIQGTKKRPFMRTDLDDLRSNAVDVFVFNCQSGLGSPDHARAQSRCPG